jgi:hypothetical protein
MKRTYIVLGVDIVGYSIPSTVDRNKIKEKFDESILSFLLARNKTRVIPTGDGCFIGFDIGIHSVDIPLDLIVYLMEEMDDVEFRYAISYGQIELKKDINNNDTFDGDVLIETKRLLDSFSSGNIILASYSFYKNYQ